MQKNGMDVKVMDQNDLDPIKKKYGIMKTIEACHTGIIDGYIIEGHVPASDIKKILKDKPKIKGLAVRGMPHGSPGMDTGRMDNYHVLSFDSKGKISVFKRH